MTPAMGELKAAALAFMDALRPKDAVTILGFNHDVHVVASRAPDAAARRAAIEALAPSGNTALYDAIIRSAELAKAQPAPRAIVLFTDGQDVSSRSTIDGARQALLAGDVVLYVIAQGRTADDPRLRKQLESLALETGGAAHFSSRMSRLSEHFNEVVADLANQYMLVYSPERPLGDGLWRTLKVEVSDRERRFTVRSRQGYLAVRRAM
jgi:VWFA-related protein